MSERRVVPLLPDDLDQEQRELREALTESRGAGITLPDGSLRGPFDAMLRAPRTGNALQNLGGALRYRGVLSDRVRELSILLISAHHRAAFEWHAHAPIAVGLGFPESLIDAIRVGAPITLDEPAERVAAAVVTELLATGDITDTAWAEGLDVLGLAVLTELTTIVGYYGLLGLQMRVFRVPLPDGAEPVVFGTP